MQSFWHLEFGGDPYIFLGKFVDAWFEVFVRSPSHPDQAASSYIFLSIPYSQIVICIQARLSLRMSLNPKQDGNEWLLYILQPINQWDQVPAGFQKPSAPFAE